jgi:methyl-accepting chemotaxis protein
MSIRTILWSIMGLLGALLVCLSVAEVASTWTYYRDTQRVGALVGASRALFGALQAERLERGTGLISLSKADPVDTANWTTITTNRAVTESSLADGVQQLTMMNRPELVPLLAELRSTHDALVALRPAMDAAIRQPKAARDPSLLQSWPQAGQTFLDALNKVTDVSEGALKLSNPTIDELLAVKRAAWLSRSYAGTVVLRLLATLGSGQAWTAADITQTADDRGRIAVGWSLVTETAARPEAPPALVSAVNKAQVYFKGPMADEQSAIIQTLSTGGKPAVSLPDVQVREVEGIGLIADVANVAMAEMAALNTRQASTILVTLLLDVGMALVALVVTVAGLVVVTRRVCKPLQALTAAMGQLAAGDTATPVPGGDRGDEVGAMAGAVQVFKEHMIAAAELAETQEAERAAKERHTARLRSLVSGFETKIGHMVGLLAAGSTELEATAKSMRSTATQTDEQAGTVAAAAEEASMGVQTVASAAEELAASIAEISRQVMQSAKITEKAVTDAQRTDTIVRTLSDAAEKIGHVVGLIANIAGQTNLLALNATIEAARAGDAGKGFAVVASEVKSLATQTARATDDIGVQVSQIQAATKEAVDAIRTITTTIEDVSRIAASIASAVEQQGGATAEIARNVQQTAQAAHDVTVNISGVSRASNDTGAAAGEVLSAAGELSQQAEHLSAEVNNFLADVRAS